MFQSAVVKLTSWYVGALVLVCLLFSIPIYAITTTRLRSSGLRQTDYVRQLPNQFNAQRIVPQLEVVREQQLRRDREQLILNLLIINAAIIGTGAYASYLFARRTLRPIEEAHATQAQFTANASHELRTPLAVMQTEIDVALRNKKLSSAEAREILQSNLEEVARLRQLSDQLLGLTRAEAEQMKLEKVDVAKLIQSQMDLLASRYNIPIAVQVKKLVHVMADELLLAQVLDIIVENAVTYSGLEDPKISVGLVSDKQQAVITITNQGKVIAKKDLEQIFDRFYRGAQATSQNPTGHGLGLALAKDLVVRHGGEITATSSKNGTVFSIQLDHAS
ncbi:HAMP domain-containing histidine kinase [Candidatus Saccharibacteria bacterium]|nr:MAG: HAMP domain-containing histidine kinase [Candidatus Saccharibacteria bacterium]